MDLEDVAAGLYAVPPEEFTAARTEQVARATAAGDREAAAAVRSLRKPTLGAWLLNQLARQRQGLVTEVLELGIELRAAQGTLPPAELRALDQRRRRLTADVARQAVDLGRAAGRSVSTQAAADVHESVRSAMVDAQAGAALASGLLTGTFTATGLAPVDLSRVVALPDLVLRTQTTAGSGAGRPSAPRSRRAGREVDAAAVRDAQRALTDAQAALEAATHESETTRAQAVTARRRREELESRVEEARRALLDRQSDLTAAAQDEDDSRRAQLRATRTERSAAQAAQRAQDRLDRLLREQAGRSQGQPAEIVSESSSPS